MQFFFLSERQREREVVCVCERETERGVELIFFIGRFFFKPATLFQVSEFFFHFSKPGCDFFILAKGYFLSETAWIFLAPIKCRISKIGPLIFKKPAQQPQHKNQYGFFSFHAQIIKEKIVFVSPDRAASQK